MKEEIKQKTVRDAIVESDQYIPIFNLLHSYGVILVEEEMDELIKIVHENFPNPCKT